MNDDLMDEIYQSGLGLTSPATESIENAQGDLANAKADIARLPVADDDNPLGFDPEVIARANAAIDGANGILITNKGYVTEMNNNLFSTVTQANAASRIDGMPDGCNNINQITGTVTGAANYLYEQISQIAKDISQSVNDWFDGVIDQEEMTARLNALDGLLSGPLDTITALMDEESQYLSSMIRRVQSSTLAQSLRSLWNDPCVNGALTSNLPDRIKDLLP